MLKLRHDGKLRWSEHDVLAMARILGSENAVKRVAPYVASIPKLARIRGIELSRMVQAKLHKEIALRQEVKLIKNLDDAPGDPNLWWHQRVDVNYFAATQLASYLIAEEASVGKTYVATDWIKMIGAKRILVICPGEVKEQWVDAILQRLGPFQATRMLAGRIDEQIEQIVTMRQGWVIAHWESLVHARIGFLEKPWDAVIGDEIHLAQNRKAQRTQTLFDLDTKFKMALSGNPYSKDPSQMWSILHWLYPDIYTSFWRFVHMHIALVPGPFDNILFDGVRRPKLLRWEIAPFTLRRTVAQVRPNVPKVRQARRLASLTIRGEREYKRLQKSLFAELDAIGDDTTTIPIFNALSRTTRLRQYVIDPALIGAREPSVKYPMVWRLMQELNTPLVIFSQYTQALIRLMEYLKQQNKKIKRGLIIGRKHRHPATHDAKQRFLAGDVDILGVSGKKGGLGLNLGKYGLVSMLDLPWHFRDWDQWIRRVDRPEEGTGKSVATINYRFVVRGTYEMKMERRIESTNYEFGKVFSIGDIKEIFG